MKATIKQDGTLYITPETELETYALGAWGKENHQKGESKGPKMVIKTAYEPGEDNE